MKYGECMTMSCPNANTLLMFTNSYVTK